MKKHLIFVLLSLFSKTTDAYKWGVSTSAYQIEGAWDIDGKGLSVWDTFSQSPSHISDQSNGNIACDHFHHWEDDLNWIEWLGVDAYRFSISWPRILPTGKIDHINHAGIEFYNRLIDGLLERGIQPMITLWHWDTPQHLQDLYRGWEDDKIIEDFKNYAKLCFQEFGDRVKLWITLNEPLTVVQLGYAKQDHAPGVGEPSVLPYSVAHRMIRTHAKVYWMYHDLFSEQGGKISIALNSDFVLPGTSSTQDQEASERAIIWRMGWFADPFFFGKYPEQMVERCGNRLPQFSDRDQVAGTLDFFSLNHYTTLLGYSSSNQNQNLFEDPQVYTGFPPVSTPSASPWLHSYPPGIGHMIQWILDRYPMENISLAVTESGISTYPGELSDQSRQDYIHHYSLEVEKFGNNISHYCVWSLLDNFEWAVGYSERFGLFDIQFQDVERTRTPKRSAIWLKDYLQSKKLI